MGLHEWAYSNNYNTAERQKMMHVDLPVRFASMSTEVEKGFTAEQTRAEVERCLNCDMETHFIDSLCIECDACIDICPVDCLTITPNADEPELRTRFAAPAENLDQPLFVSGPPQADRTGDDQGRERLPALRAVRRAVPDLRMGHAQIHAADSVCGSDGDSADGGVGNLP